MSSDAAPQDWVECLITVSARRSVVRQSNEVKSPAEAGAYAVSAMRTHHGAAGRFASGLLGVRLFGLVVLVI